jgi:hypothetical protein
MFAIITPALISGENDLAAVRSLPKRYAEAVGHGPFVASIAITPIAKAAAGKG